MIILRLFAHNFIQFYFAIFFTNVKATAVRQYEGRIRQIAEPDYNNIENDQEKFLEITTS